MEYEKLDMMSEMDFNDKLEEYASKGSLELAKFMARQQFRQEKLCVHMTNHMAEINGTIGEMKEEQGRAKLERDTIIANQCRLSARAWEQISWKTKLIFLGFIILLVSNLFIEGIGVEKLGGFTSSLFHLL